MFGIGGFELFIILIFGFLIFGPEKLPDIARTVGKGIARFREAQADMNETLGNDKIFDPNNPDEPFKDPIEALDKLAARQEEKRREKEAAQSAKANAKAESQNAGEQESGKTAAGGATESASDAKPEPRQESFTERKARYERERAARRAAEANAAKGDAKGAEADSAQAPDNARDEAGEPPKPDGAAAKSDEGGDA